jgi:glycogenin glucosyltransferase
MSEETKLFTPPAKYPDPPKDMYYEVPEKAPEPPKPKQIFPWESHVRKAARVFPAKPPEPQPQPEPEPEPAATAAAADTAASAKEPSLSDQERPTSPMALEWQTYGNAWDDMPEIERYVQAFAQHRRGPIQVLHQSARAGGSKDILSPAEPRRRPSMKVTDFPTEIERPSLPVTPAPIRRPSFWGEERDEQGELPAAEGVPKQEEWVRRFSSYSAPQFASDDPSKRVLYWRCQFCGKQNPVLKLEELQRRQSEVIQAGPKPKSNDIPDRQMPESKDAAAAAAASDRGALSRQGLKPILKEPHFESEKLSDAAGGATKDIAPEVTASA